VAVDGRVAVLLVLGVEWVHGIGVDKEVIACSTRFWGSSGGGGIIRGAAGRLITSEALVVTLLQSALPSGKLSL
jgi:hypothetical protein